METKHNFRVQQITNAERSGDSNLSSEGEETGLDKDINFKSDLLSCSGSSASESDDRRKRN